MLFLVSPTDLELAEALGDDAITSSLPERRGADVLAWCRPGVLGVQRKHVPEDFAASIDDGRLAWELPLLFKHTDFPILITEGDFWFNAEGKLAKKYGGKWEFWRYTKRQVYSILRSVRWVHGVDWEHTDDLQDTVNRLRELVAYLEDDTHLSLFRRPAPRGEWGRLSQSERLRWILQGFEGIGVKQAERILAHCGGKAPLGWTLTETELTQIRGIGKPTARKLYKALE